MCFFKSGIFKFVFPNPEIVHFNQGHEIMAVFIRSSSGFGNFISFGNRKILQVVRSPENIEKRKVVSLIMLLKFQTGIFFTDHSRIVQIADTAFNGFIVP